jgi:hypothetical protein
VADARKIAVLARKCTIFASVAAIVTATYAQNFSFVPTPKREKNICCRRRMPFLSH